MFKKASNQLAVSKFPLVLAGSSGGSSSDSPSSVSEENDDGLARFYVDFDEILKLF